MKVAEGVGEGEDRAILEQGVGDKQERAPETTVFGEVGPSALNSGGEDAGTALNCEEQEGARPEEDKGGRTAEVGGALTGEGERFLKLGLKADTPAGGSGFWSELG